MNFPAVFAIELSSETSCVLEGLIFQLKVSTGQKDPYFILLPKTNEVGRTEITHEDFVGQFKDHWEMGLMDDSGTPEEADKNIELSLFDPTWLIENQNLALAWPLFKNEKNKWSTRKEEYDYKVSCRNKEHSFAPIIINIETEQTVSLVVIKDRIKAVQPYNQADGK